MKPLKLTMSAFGTFAKKTIIDFETISRDGVFLITGSNGSGKTTIFDAISFALYGETCNAKRRGKKEMHSDFVSIQEKSSVGLKFLHQDQIFVVKRVLAFSESGKNPTAKAFLYLEQPDKKFDLIAEGVTNVNNKIQGMLGMTQGEFNQTVMIAQGEFQQIVNADTKTRMALFRKLFHTKIYSDFEARLQERYKILKDQSDNCQEKITAALESLQFRPDFQPDAPKNAICADMYLNALEQQALYDQKIIADLETRKKTCRNEQESLIQMLTQAEQSNQKLQELSRYQQELQKLQSHIPEIQNQQKQIRKAQDALQISGIEKILLQTERNLSLQKQNQNALQSNLLSQKTAFQEAEKNLLAANQNAEKIPALIQREYELNQTLPKYQELRDAESNEQKYAALVKQLSFQYETESRNYTRIFQDFCLGQAGLLSETLQPGMPCPVCGSQEHPAPAVRHSHTPSKNQLDKAQKSRDDAEKNLSQATQTCAEYHSRLETLRKENPLLEQHSEQILLQELRDCRREIKQLQQKQTSAQKTFEQIKSQCDRSAVQLQETEKQITALKHDLSHCEQDFRKALQDYQFQNPEDYENAKLSPDTIRKLEQEIQNFQSRMQQFQTLTEKLRKETADMEYIHTEDLKMQKSGKDQLYSELESEYRNICLIHSANQKIAQKLPAMTEEYHRIYQELQDYEELYRTVSGTKGSGQSKFKLEAYVQQYYFRRVILQARQRLAILTNQKFDLRCRETAKNNISQFGLDLEILDLATNQWRDVSTLSGGESFMLALSLALGLSDIIQESSGGIQIDAMFIDEGFGSLDETSLNQAVELLGKLADGKRLIGVISHVESLISRIDSKIYVTKTATGSEVAFS